MLKQLSDFSSHFTQTSGQKNGDWSLWFNILNGIIMVQWSTTLNTTIQIVNGHNFAYCVDRALLPPLPDNHQTLMELFEVTILVQSS